MPVSDKDTTVRESRPEVHVLSDLETTTGDESAQDQHYSPVCSRVELSVVRDNVDQPTAMVIEAGLQHSISDSEVDLEYTPASSTEFSQDSDQHVQL